MKLPKTKEKYSTTDIYELRRELEPFIAANTDIQKLYEKLGKVEIQINKHFMEVYKKNTGKEFKY